MASAVEPNGSPSYTVPSSRMSRAGIGRDYSDRCAIARYLPSALPALTRVVCGVRAAWSEIHEPAVRNRQRAIAQTTPKADNAPGADNAAEPQLTRAATPRPDS